MVVVIADNAIDDLNDMADIVRKALPDTQVVPFQDELLAAKYVFNNPVQLLIARANNRRMSGFEILRFARKAPIVPDVVIASEAEELRKDAMKAGAAGFLSIPSSVQKLQELLSTAHTEWEF